MFDHNGTYMRGVAVQQKNAMVVVETLADFEEEIRGNYELQVYGNGFEIAISCISELNLVAEISFRKHCCFCAGDYS